MHGRFHGQKSLARCSRPQGPKEEEKQRTQKLRGFPVHGRLRLAWWFRQPRGSSSQVALDTEVPRGLAPHTGPLVSLPTEPEVRLRPQKCSNFLWGLVARHAPFPHRARRSRFSDRLPPATASPGTQASSAPPGARGQKEPGSREEAAGSGSREEAAVSHPGIGLLSVTLRSFLTPCAASAGGS